MFKVTNYQTKMYHIDADIEISDNGKKGVSKLTIYKDNKKKAGKKEETIMISKKSKQDSNFTKLLSEDVVQFVLDGLLTRSITEDVFKILQTNKFPARSELKCNQCDKTFISNQGRALHMTLIHKKPIIKCDICREIFKSVKFLAIHREVKHNIKRTASEMKTGQNSNDKDTFKCTRCNIYSSNKSDFNDHMKTHKVFAVPNSPPAKRIKSHMEVKNDYMKKIKKPKNSEKTRFERNRDGKNGDWNFTLW